MLQYLRLCRFNRHAPTDGKVAWDGLHYTSHCRWCAAPVRRRSHKRWERDWLEPSPPSSG